MGPYWAHLYSTIQVARKACVGAHQLINKKSWDSGRLGSPGGRGNQHQNLLFVCISPVDINRGFKVKSLKIDIGPSWPTPLNCIFMFYQCEPEGALWLHSVWIGYCQNVTIIVIIITTIICTKMPSSSRETILSILAMSFFWVQNLIGQRLTILSEL